MRTCLKGDVHGQVGKNGAFVNISLQTSLHSSSNTCRAQNVIVSLALRIVSKSVIPTVLKAIHINWEKPSLNQQVQHVNLTLTL